MQYAAYGSNLHPARLAERLPSARFRGTGRLPDWSLRFHKLSKDASGKCSIVRGDEGVYFAIFDISENDKTTLDRIEGVGSGYDAASLHIPPYGECATYIAQASHVDHSLQPYDWYKELVLLGARHHGFPDDYLARIELTQAISDPDTARSINQWALAGRIRVGV